MQDEFPKLRKAIARGGAALAVLLMVALVVSQWYDMFWLTTTVVIGAGESAFVFVFGEDVARQAHCGWQMQRSLRPWSFLGMWFALESNSTESIVVIPIWFPLLLTLIAAGLAWRAEISARRRREAHLCATPACRYDRAGLAPQAPCPECGRVPTPALRPD